MRTAILFDLDGTLLPMDLERFTKGYFGLLTAEMAKHGYDPQLLVKALLSGIGAMGKGDGTVTCEQLFWDDAKRILGDGCIRDIPFFDAFYKDGFRGAKRFTEPDPAHSVRQLRRHTNPPRSWRLRQSAFSVFRNRRTP